MGGFTLELLSRYTVFGNIKYSDSRGDAEARRNTRMNQLRPSHRPGTVFFRRLCGSARVIGLLFLSSLALSAAHAEEVRIAVASNFVPTLKKVGKAFTKKTG